MTDFSPEDDATSDVESSDLALQVKRRNRPGLQANQPVPPDAATLRSRAFELIGASALGVTQPLLNLLGDNPVFFVAHGVTSWQLLTYALVLTFAVPIVVFVISTALSFAVPRVGAFVHDGAIGMLVAVILAPPIARALGATTGPWALVWLGLLVLISIGAVVLIRRVEPVRTFLRLLALSPILFIGFFLFASPTSDLLSLGDGADVPTISTAQTAPVVWFVLDQFPLSFIVDSNGEIISERYPNLARLAELSTWYPNAIAGTDRTELSVPSALTGNWPAWEELPVASRQPVNLFTLLGSDEYPVQAEEYVTQLCPDSICDRSATERSNSTWPDTIAVWVRYVLPERAADRLVPVIDDRWDGFGDRADGNTGNGSDNSVNADPSDTVDPSFNTETATGPVVEGEAQNYSQMRENMERADENSVRFLRFLEGLKSPDLQGVHYAHLLLPHEPLRYLPDGRTMNLPWVITPEKGGRWPDSEAAMRTRLQRAMGQTMYADRLVGEMLDALEGAGTLDDAAIVVMSDHGASTRPGVINRSSVDLDSAVDTAPLPIFIKAPGQTAGRTDDRRVQQVDILPTLLDLLGVPISADADGSFIDDGSTIERHVRFDGLSATEDNINDKRWTEREVTRLTGDGAEIFAQRPIVSESPTISWIDEVFPDPTDPFTLRPFLGLVGQTVSNSAIDDLGQAEFTVTFDRSDAFDNVDPMGPDLPVAITAVINGQSAPTAIAVAVNGKIAGATESFTLRDEHRLSVVINPDTLIAGRNNVTLLAVPMADLVVDSLETWQVVSPTN